MKVKVNHASALSLPPVEGHRGGYQVEPGETELPDEYVMAIVDNPTVQAWVGAGFLELDAPEVPKKSKGSKKNPKPEDE